MKKRIFYGFVIVLFVFVLTGCGSSDEKNSFSGTGTIYRYGTEDLYNGDSIAEIDYVTDPSSLHRTTYLKHEVEDFTITKTYVCFVTDQEYCMESGEGLEEENRKILEANDSWFYDHDGRCLYGTGIFRTYCFGGGFSNLELASSAIIVELSNDEYCSSNYLSGSSSCH